MNENVKKIELPDNPKTRKALKNLLDKKAAMRLEQKKELEDYVAKLKKPAV